MRECCAEGTSRATAPMVASALPELARGDARTLGHRGHLRPHNVGIDGGLSHPRAEAAVASGDHVFPAHQLRVTADALCDELGMLDEVRLRFDHAGNEKLAFGQFPRFEKLPLVR